MKFCIIIFSIFFAIIYCDLSLVTEITELTDLNTVVRTAINLSSTHSPNITNSFVRHRQDFKIEFLMDMINRFNTRSLEIQEAIVTDSQQLLVFYSSNQVLHAAVQGSVNNLVSVIAAVTETLVSILRNKSKISVPTGDFIIHDVEENHKRLRPKINFHDRGCSNDFHDSYRSMVLKTRPCDNTALTSCEVLYFEWGFKLADVYQDFLDAIDIKTLMKLSNEEVLFRFLEFDEEIRGVLLNFGKFGVKHVENAYDVYMSCMTDILVSSRTHEQSFRRRPECFNLQPTVSLSLTILGKKILK